MNWSNFFDFLLNKKIPNWFVISVGIPLILLLYLFIVNVMISENLRFLDWKDQYYPNFDYSDDSFYYYGDSHVTMSSDEEINDNILFLKSVRIFLVVLFGFMLIVTFIYMYFLVIR